MGGGKLLASATRRTNNEGDWALTTKHVVDFRGVIHNFIHREDDEIDRHNLHHGTQSKHRSTSSHSYKTIFTNWRIHHSFRTKFLQETCGDFIRSLEDADLLTHEEHIFIT